MSNGKENDRSSFLDTRWTSNDMKMVDIDFDNKDDDDV